MRYAYLDESGDVAPFSGSRFLVVAVLVTETPRTVELQVKRVRQSLGRKVRPQELKATWSKLRVIERFLGSINRDDISVWLWLWTSERLSARPLIQKRFIARL